MGISKVFDGRLLAEYDIYGICLKEYIYMGGRLVAEYSPATSQYVYYTQDQIGSTRIVTDDTGMVVYAEAHDPYGGIQKTWPGNTFDPKRKFSDKERDEETSLDYFGARYYAASSYRWISVDPMITERAINNPQEWNLYSYSKNNPTTFFDPDGRLVMMPSGNIVDPYVIQQALNVIGRYISATRAIATLVYGREGLERWIETETPYKERAGDNSEIGVGVDCSGVTSHMIRGYNPAWTHQGTATFVASTNPGGKNEKIIGKLPKGWALQAGDIAWWPGHVAVYAYRQNGVDYMYNAPGDGSKFRIQRLSGLVSYFGRPPIWFRLYMR